MEGRSWGCVRVVLHPVTVVPWWWVVGCRHPGRGFLGFSVVYVGNGRYLCKYLRSDGLFIVKR